MAQDILNKVINEHFLLDKEIFSYLNDNKIIEADEKYISQYEVCNRDGKTLAIWMDSNSYTLNTLIPYLGESYEFITEDMLNTYKVLCSFNKQESKQVVINFDKFNSRMRIYFLHNPTLYGYDIEISGEVSKSKIYELSGDYKVITKHSTGKVTEAYKKPTDYGFELIRDDGQIYYTYLKRKGLEWQY